MSDDTFVDKRLTGARNGVRTSSTAPAPTLDTARTDAELVGYLRECLHPESLHIAGLCATELARRLADAQEALATERLVSAEATNLMCVPDPPLPVGSYLRRDEFDAWKAAWVHRGEARSELRRILAAAREAIGVSDE